MLIYWKIISLLFFLSVLSATTPLTSCFTVCPNKPGTATINSSWINVSPRWGKTYHRQCCTCILCTWILCELNNQGAENWWTLCFALLHGAWLLTWLCIGVKYTEYNFYDQILKSMWINIYNAVHFTATFYGGEYLYNGVLKS